MKQIKKYIICLVILMNIIPLNTYAYSARSITAIDLDSGRILYEKNHNEKSLIASITKIMTAIVSLENIKDINKTITIGEEVLKMYGTNIYIEVGERIKIKDLLYGLLLRSGNDASVTLATNILGETKFIEQMNITAKKIGMTNTIFSNPHGLDEETKNYSTSHDMALLSRYAYKNTIYRKISSTKKYELSTGKKTYLWYNRNKLLNNYKYCTGGKNGYTPKAGKTLVTTASKNNLNISIVTLDDNDEYTTHESIYEKLFSEYRNYTIIDKSNFSIDKNFYENEVYLKESFTYPLKDSELKDISTQVELTNKSNKEAGKIIIKLNKKKIGELIIYQKQIKKESLFTKIKTFFKNIIHG